MADLLDLATWMQKLSGAINAFGNETVKDVANVIVTDLAQVTPVDVGTAVSNWQVTLDAPASNIISAYAPSPKGFTRNGTFVHSVDPVITAQANVPPTLDAARIVIKGKVPGQELYITNNLPYIEGLDLGSSRQAPAGFVQRAIVLGQQFASRVKMP